MSETASPPAKAAPILVALGANLPTEQYGSPQAALEAALEELSRRGVKAVRRSRWYESAPVPPSDQPWFVNGVVEVMTHLGPEALLAVLHETEAAFGRARREANAPRTLDLDLIAYGDLVRTESGPPPALPHPRMVGRAFVLLPLAEICPNWRHPVLGRTAAELAAELPRDQPIRVAQG
ncbi:MAG TPA: 2-amino-4-hydroxy-6-hydroxymethyldihydropteridine diphosphokinase [Alphaproteobacteria bacterium]|nr:2-amino-4-hydroxy-6-hydroxymethyldihydropteridine diphosphokinase [Alphaproteobacteria bacterium]